MPRTAITFAALFATEFLLSIEWDEVEMDAKQRANLVRHLNAGYRAAWQYEGVAWEDSWEEGAVAVAAGLIDYATIDDAHVFNFWSEDPRLNRAAQWIEASSAKTGLFVGSTWNAGVFGFWRPQCPQWDGEDEETEIITLLKDATLAFAQAEYWRAAGKHDTAAQRRKDGKDACEALAAVEFERLQTQWWLRRKS